MAKFTDIAPELLSKILVNLSLSDIIHCKQLSRFFLEVINSSIDINYKVQTQMSGVLDNSRCKLPITERLSALKARDGSWEFFKPVSVNDIPIPLKSTGEYDVSSVNFLLGIASEEEGGGTKGIQYLNLPTKFPEPDAEAEEEGSYTWSRMNLPMPTIDFVMAVEEHDILANAVTIESDDDPEIYDIYIVILRHSTHQMHDGSENPIFRVGRATKAEGSPSIRMDVCGENIAFAIVFSNSSSRDNDYMCVFNWKTGKLKSGMYTAYTPALVFLREDILLFPNSLSNSLDLYHIPPSTDLELNSTKPDLPSPPIHVRVIHSLLLPPFKPDWYITSVGCRSTPNPTADGGIPEYTPTSRPFVSDPMRAIILMTMRVTNSTERSKRSVFNIIMHRKALLDLIPAERFEHVKSLANSLRKTRDEPVGSDDAADLAARLEGVSLASGDVIVKKPWDEWGPSATRWFDMKGYSNLFVASTSGQRYVQYGISPTAEAEEGAPPPKPNTIHVLDFNYYTLKRAWNGLGKPGPFRSPWCTVSIVGMTTPSNPEEEPAENVLPAGEVFVSNVVGRLPYVRCTSHKEWTYGGVMISDELLIGMRIDFSTYAFTSMGLIHFG